MCNPTRHDKRSAFDCRSSLSSVYFSHFPECHFLPASIEAFAFTLLLSFTPIIFLCYFRSNICKLFLVYLKMNILSPSISDRRTDDISCGHPRPYYCFAQPDHLPMHTKCINIWRKFPFLLQSTTTVYCKAHRLTSPLPFLVAIPALQYFKYISKASTGTGILQT